MCCDLCMLASRGKTKGGWFFILGFNMLKPNMSNTISIGTCSSDLYIHYFFETSGTASCGTTGTYTEHLLRQTTSMPDNFYTRHFLHQAPFSPFLPNTVLQQTSFTPHNFYTKHPCTPETVACPTMSPRFAT